MCVANQTPHGLVMQDELVKAWFGSSVAQTSWGPPPYQDGGGEVELGCCVCVGGVTLLVEMQRLKGLLSMQSANEKPIFHKKLLIR